MTISISDDTVHYWDIVRDETNSPYYLTFCGMRTMSVHRPYPRAQQQVYDAPASCDACILLRFEEEARDGLVYTECLPEMLWWQMRVNGGPQPPAVGYD